MTAQWGIEMGILRLLLTSVLMLLSNLSSAQGLAVSGYDLVSSTQQVGPLVKYTYRVQVTNTGAPAYGVVLTVTSNSPNTQVLTGTLNFGDIDALTTVTLGATISFYDSRPPPANLSNLVWTFSVASLRSYFTFTPSSGSAPLSVRFTPRPITNAAINLFQWDFDGDGVIDVSDTVGRDQVRTFSSPGTYAVSLKVTDSQGRTDTRVQNVVVTNAPPVVTVSASPTNGPVPLTVSFVASATDNEGVASFEWDFDGDGVYDRTITGTSGNTTYTYASVGSFAPRLRVSDRMGAKTLVSVPSMAVRVAPVGSAQLVLSLSSSSGLAPLGVTLSATASNLLGRTVQSYQWDADGDGAFDGTTTSSSFVFSYLTAGTFYPRVRIMLSDGSQVDDVKQVTVTSTVALSLGTDTLDAQLLQSIGITTTLSAATRASLVVETRSGTPVRTVLPWTNRAAGTFADTWDGKNNAGQYVAEGIYKVVLLYEAGGVQQRLDLSSTTGGSEYNPPRTSIGAFFDPYDSGPLTIDFTLSRASEVTAFMGSFEVNTRYVTFYTRQAFGRGTHRITWNGDNAEGQIIKPAFDDAFLFGIFGYTLPDNGVFVRNGVQLSSMTSWPPIFDPTGLTSAATPIRCSVQFTLSLPATAELVIQDSISGAVVNRLQFPGLAAGINNVLWDGKTSNGLYAAPGTYRLGVTAIQANGFRSLTSYVLQRVYY